MFDELLLGGGAARDFMVAIHIVEKNPKLKVATWEAPGKDVLGKVKVYQAGGVGTLTHC